jgi:hypothetical protein
MDGLVTEHYLETGEMDIDLGEFIQNRRTEIMNLLQQALTIQQ